MMIKVMVLMITDDCRIDAFDDDDDDDDDDINHEHNSLMEYD